MLSWLQDPTLNLDNMQGNQICARNQNHLQVFLTVPPWMFYPQVPQMANSCVWHAYIIASTQYCLSNLAFYSIQRMPFIQQGTIQSLCHTILLRCATQYKVSHNSIIFANIMERIRSVFSSIIRSQPSNLPTCLGFN